ncbi:hypothetical protein DP73_00730 [Desulfosporosinus sp. HMP52]|nr:hypothetical protein DP73_00730 [Desulfosporosinus sp. HMP52]
MRYPSSICFPNYVALYVCSFISARVFEECNKNKKRTNQICWLPKEINANITNIVSFNAYEVSCRVRAEKLLYAIRRFTPRIGSPVFLLEIQQMD